MSFTKRFLELYKQHKPEKESTRDKDMNERKANAILLCFLVCLLVPGGCDRGVKQRDKAITEATEANAELAEIKAVLEKTKSERDKLRESMAESAGVLEDTQTKLTNMVQIQENLERQLVELTKQRDTAFVKLQDTQAMATTLRSQLEEKTAEIQKLTQWNSEWQGVVQELQSQIEQAAEQVVEQPVEQAIEEPNEVPEEQLQEEIINEDNV
jgi:chromosome segregation ATPase